MKSLIFLAPIFFISYFSLANDSIPAHRFDIGLRSMKYVGFYWENGVAIEYSSTKILDHKIQFGLNIVSSHLGSAFFTNAVPSSQFELSVMKHFRHEKNFQPLVRLNTGMVHANYRSEEFNNLQQNGFLLSAELGLSYRLPVAKKHFSLKAGIGYNLVAGNGIKGVSTVYPIYGQFSVLYRLK